MCFNSMAGFGNGLNLSFSNIKINGISPQKRNKLLIFSYGIRSDRRFVRITVQKKILFNLLHTTKKTKTSR